MICLPNVFCAIQNTFQTFFGRDLNDEVSPIQRKILMRGAEIRHTKKNHENYENLKIHRKMTIFHFRRNFCSSWEVFPLNSSLTRPKKCVKQHRKRFEDKLEISNSDHFRTASFWQNLAIHVPF